MVCEWCYDGEVSWHDCRAFHQEMQEHFEDEYQRERVRSIVVLSARMLAPETWRRLAEDLREMEWGCWREADAWWWLWIRVLAVRAVICLVMNWHRCPDRSECYWIEDLWTEGEYWYWVSVGQGWWDWWAYVDRDCPERNY